MRELRLYVAYVAEWKKNKSSSCIGWSVIYILNVSNFSLEYSGDVYIGTCCIEKRLVESLVLAAQKRYLLLTYAYWEHRSSCWQDLNVLSWNWHHFPLKESNVRLFGRNLESDIPHVPSYGHRIWKVMFICKVMIVYRLVRQWQCRRERLIRRGRNLVWYRM